MQPQGEAQYLPMAQPEHDASTESMEPTPSVTSYSSSVTEADSPELPGSSSVQAPNQPHTPSPPARTSFVPYRRQQTEHESKPDTATGAGPLDWQPPTDGELINYAELVSWITDQPGTSTASSTTLHSSPVTGSPALTVQQQRYRDHGHGGRDSAAAAGQSGAADDQHASHGDAGTRFRVSLADGMDLRPHSVQVVPGDATPISFQIGRHTYIRQDAQDDVAARVESMLLRKEQQQQQQQQQQPRLSSEAAIEATAKAAAPEGPAAAGLGPRKGNPGGPPLDLWHECAFVFIIATAQALMLAGVGQAMVPAATVGASFGLHGPGELAWFSASYALTAGTFVLPAGRMGDLFGHKRVFVLGAFWFAAWSLVVGFALMASRGGGDGPVFFNVCRGLQGIGPAMLVPNGQAMLGRAYRPGPRKNVVMSLFGAAAPFGFVVGGVMSSLLSQVVSWPWAFWVLAAVCVVLGTASIVLLPSPSPTTPTRRNDRDSIWRQIDLAGCLLGLAGLVLFNFAWNQAPLVTWNVAYTYFILIISLILLGFFVYIEMRAKYPLVPIKAMRAETNFILACTAAGWGGFSVWVFYAFQVMQNFRGWSPLLSAASFAHAPVAGLAASLLVARMMSRMAPHWIMMISMFAFLLGAVLMATAPVGQTYWANTFISILIMPFGMDMSNPAATILLSNSVAKEHQGVAASLVVTVVNYSISTALGIAATVDLYVGRMGTDVLAGYRGGQYLGVGLNGLGLLVSFAFSTTSILKARRAQRAALEVDEAAPRREKG